jgi:hypothetical protein
MDKWGVVLHAVLPRHKAEQILMPPECCMSPNPLAVAAEMKWTSTFPLICFSGPLFPCNANHLDTALSAVFNTDVLFHTDGDFACFKNSF